MAHGPTPESLQTKKECSLHLHRQLYLFSLLQNVASRCLDLSSPFFSGNLSVVFFNAVLFQELSQQGWRIRFNTVQLLLAKKRIIGSTTTREKESQAFARMSPQHVPNAIRCAYLNPTFAFVTWIWSDYFLAIILLLFTGNKIFSYSLDLLHFPFFTLILCGCLRKKRYRKTFYQT